MTQCPKCNSKDVIDDGAVFDTTRNSTQVLAAGFQKNPKAWLFTGDARYAVRASICGNCGFLEMFVQDPGKLMADYRQAREG